MRNERENCKTARLKKVEISISAMDQTDKNEEEHEENC
jgi:hypothetical protein